MFSIPVKSSWIIIFSAPTFNTIINTFSKPCFSFFKIFALTFPKCWAFYVICCQTWEVRAIKSYCMFMVFVYMLCDPLNLFRFAEISSVFVLLDTKVHTSVILLHIELYIFIRSSTCFRVNPHSIVA